MFYNLVRKHVGNGMLSPVEFERQQILKAESVWKTWGYSDGQIVSSYDFVPIDCPPPRIYANLWPYYPHPPI